MAASTALPLSALGVELLSALRSAEGRALLREIGIEARQAQAHDPDERITVAAAAAIRGVSRAAIYKSISDGALAAHRHGKHGRAIRIRRGDVEGGR